MNFFKKNARVSGGLTWFVGFIIIFFIMFLFVMGSSSLALDLKGLKKGNKIQFSSLSQEFSEEEILIRRLNTPNDFYGEIKTIEELLIDLVNNLSLERKTYTQHHFVYSSGSPYGLLNKENKARVNYIRTELLGHSKSCVFDSGDIISYPVLILELDNKNIISFQPGHAITNIDDSKKQEIWVSFSPGKIGKLMIAESTSYGLDSHNKIHTALDAKTSSSGGGLLDMGETMRDGGLKKEISKLCVNREDVNEK